MSSERRETLARFAGARFVLITRFGYRPVVSLGRNLLRWLSGWLITTILFTQIAVAAYACPQVPSRTDAGVVAMAGMPCAEMMPKALALDTEQPALCLHHCQFGSTGGQPADHSAPVVVAMAALLLLFTLLPTAVRPTGGFVWLTRERRRDRAPPTPHSILHCCHRI